MTAARQEWPGIDGAVNHREKHYGHRKACCARVEDGLDGFIKLGLPGSGHDGIDHVNFGMVQNSINLLLKMGLWGVFRSF